MIEEEGEVRITRRYSGEYDAPYALVEPTEEGALNSAGLGVAVELAVVGGLDSGFDRVEGID